MTTSDRFSPSETYTVLTAEFMHESNTFNKYETDLDAFTKRFYFEGDEAIRERGSVNTELGGFCDIAKTYKWNLVHVLSTSAEPSGKVTKNAFNLIVDRIIQSATNLCQNPTGLHGVLLGLHGAMVTDFCDDGEGELLMRLRNVIGPSVPVAVTLDLHANVTPQMCSLADIIVSYKTYPHVDMRTCGQQAGEILQLAMTQKCIPKTIRAIRPMLEEVNGGRTDVGPMVELIRRITEYENVNDSVFAVSINAGFGNADIEHVGPTVLVTFDSQEQDDKHRAFIESIADGLWDSRFEVMNTYMSVEEVANVAKTHDNECVDARDRIEKSQDIIRIELPRPLIIADYADNPGVWM